MSRTKDNGIRRRRARWMIAATLSLAACMLLIFSTRGEKVNDQGQAGGAPLKAEVYYSIKNDVSPPLSELALRSPAGPSGGLRERENEELPKGDIENVSHPADSVIQRDGGGPDMPSPFLTFEGIPNLHGLFPPDPTGDVGPNHYVQWVNIDWQVFNKADGTPATPTMLGNTLWAGFGGPCQNLNNGDPIVRFDHLAGRWLMSQFALQTGQFTQCVAISTTDDPTGTWYRYAFQPNPTKVNDYPKIGVWPDAYYMTDNQFTPPFNTWAGAGVAAFEREQMLQGNPARLVYFNLFTVNPGFGGMLPGDLNGPPPPDGTPDYYAEFDKKEWITGSPFDAIRIWEFHVDWDNIANSTFGLNGTGQPNQLIQIAEFDPLCVNPSAALCIPQPGTTTKVDGIGDRLMYRLQYRNFGDHDVLMLNHSVNAANGRRAGVRWYELRNPGNNPTLYQQSTYAPLDGKNRWMASIAMDNGGNIAVGYSISSATLFPSIRYAGRLAGDPLNQLAQGEAVLQTGSGSQTAISQGRSRWGDYTTLQIDPTDDCTYWYTNEYFTTTGPSPWQTRIGAFRFPTCGAGASAGKAPTKGRPALGGNNDFTNLFTFGRRLDANRSRYTSDLDFLR